MKFQKKFFVILYVCLLLVSDPQIVRAYSLGNIRISDSGDDTETVLTEGAQQFMDLMNQMSPDEIYLRYELNGGENSLCNPECLSTGDLPFVLDVPERAGYNFAGWYTDSCYTEKITQIDASNARSMVLYAKWTAQIDNHYNVEMYSYSFTDRYSSRKKSLKDCNYNFREDVVIPGMPSTREQDYLADIISSDEQCLQGLCFTPELILMTAYAESQSDKGAMLVFDRETGDYLATLAMREDSHLGGIAYDGENIWVCHSNSTTLERISYENILEIATEAPKCTVDVSLVTGEYRLKNTPSCITCYGDRIWVATHTKFFNSRMISYSYNETEDTLCAVSSYDIPSKVQGIAFDEKGSVYLSTSYGRSNSSYLNVYTSLFSLNNYPNSPAMKVEMPPCAEEIAIADSNVYVIFESASRKYFEGTDGNGMSASPIDKMLEVTVASIW